MCGPSCPDVSSSYAAARSHPQATLTTCLSFSRGLTHGESWGGQAILPHFLWSAPAPYSTPLLHVVFSLTQEKWCPQMCLQMWVMIEYPGKSERLRRHSQRVWFSQAYLHTRVSVIRPKHSLASKKISKRRIQRSLFSSAFRPHMQLNAALFRHMSFW